MYGIVDNVVVVVWVCINIFVKQIIHFAVANFMLSKDSLVGFISILLVT